MYRHKRLAHNVDPAIGVRNLVRVEDDDDDPEDLNEDSRDRTREESEEPVGEISIQALELSQEEAENLTHYCVKTPKTVSDKMLKAVTVTVPTVASGNEYQCQHCTRLFNSAATVREHERLHETDPALADAQAAASLEADNGPKSTTCPYCRVRFESFKALSGHFLQHSWNRASYVNKCDKR
jgi:hypothetical protein